MAPVYDHIRWRPAESGLPHLQPKADRRVFGGRVDHPPHFLEFDSHSGGRCRVVALDQPHKVDMEAGGYRMVAAAKSEVCTVNLSIDQAMALGRPSDLAPPDVTKAYRRLSASETKALKSGTEYVERTATERTNPLGNGAGDSESGDKRVRVGEDSAPLGHRQDLADQRSEEAARP